MVNLEMVARIGALIWKNKKQQQQKKTPLLTLCPLETIIPSLSFPF